MVKVEKLEKRVSALFILTSLSGVSNLSFKGYFIASQNIF